MLFRSTVFGSRGPANFLSKVTIAAAVIFMLTSLSLAYLSKERTYSSTIIDLQEKPAVEQTAPAAPEATQPAPAQEPTAAPAD